MFTVAKKFNHFVYDVDHIVEDIFLVNGWLTFCLLFVNYLYESQQDVWKDIILPIMLTRWMMLLKWFTICKRVVWMFVNNDMNLLRIWLALLIRLQTSCLIIVNTRENIFKQQISMLISLCGCLPLQRSLIILFMMLIIS